MADASLFFLQVFFSQLALPLLCFSRSLSAESIHWQKQNGLSSACRFRTRNQGCLAGGPGEGFFGTSCSLDAGPGLKSHNAVDQGT
ncbi:hypothetical protein AN958_04494 [Leucoagaricus sp. SymC.cos]|nr:hypothetical protein AN958_04494 [Leucoagaricus sp. SymC.cos]